MSIVETHSLTKAYGRWRVVNDLNMHVQTGDIYGFVGRNGAGKSTVMKMICGLVTPTSGSIELFGKSAESAEVSGHAADAGTANAAGAKEIAGSGSAAVAAGAGAADSAGAAGAGNATDASGAENTSSAAAAASSKGSRAAGTIPRFMRREASSSPLAPAGGNPRIGALIESPGVLANLSVRQNLMAKALALGVPDAREQCDRVITLVGLDAVEAKKARRLSLGMRQRLGVGLALVGSPDLLLLDEPFNGLDPEGIRSMRNLILRLNQVLGTTVIISSHVLDQLDRVATRYGVIVRGCLVREMTAEQVQAECEDSLRIRTANTPRTLALLQEAMPFATFRAEPDGALVITNYGDAAAVSQTLHDLDQVIFELTVRRRNLEDYFLSLMDEGERRV